MPKNDKVHEKKVAAAMNALMRFTGMKVHEAIDYECFSKKEINNVSVRCIMSHQLFRAMESPLKNISLNTEALLDVSSLSMDADIAQTNKMTSIPIADISPPPRRIKQTMTVCALEKKHIKDMKQKNHKSYAHKEAVHLYVQEKAIPDGLSLWQVQEIIIK
jgi:hypothetical protein